MELMRLGHLLVYCLIGAVLVAVVFLNTQHTQEFRQDTCVFLCHQIYMSRTRAPQPHRPYREEGRVLVLKKVPRRKKERCQRRLPDVK